MSTCATHRLLSVALLLGCSRGDAPGGAKRGAESTPDSGGEVGDGGADGSGDAADGGDGSAPADAPFALRWSPDGASLVLLGVGGGAWLLSVGGEGPVRVQAACPGGARGGCGPAWLVASCARAAIGGEEEGPEQGWEEEGGGARLGVHCAITTTVTG